MSGLKKGAPAKDDPKKTEEENPTEQKRSQRAASNVFAMFRPNQVQEFKEAFTMIDQNRDGVIDLEDLKDMYSNLGRIPPDSELNEMLKEAPGTLNFTTFLNLFGEKMGGTDPENTIVDAFAMFDDDGKGWLPEDYVKDLLENMGDNFTKDEIKQTWKEAPIEKGKFDYKSFTGLIKGKQSEEEIAA
ncbi:myosin regulatory light chain, smooth muscle-like [Patella vulgata]|uniref:myosin regulatory light chain, smooth muscle-like n=1 Tax=Patella vulgata TaxID=6465 RepID=UPI0024A981D2|nr:myosin regulatory light chain, smooth muscle-like [Patella vulgata]